MEGVLGTIGLGGVFGSAVSSAKAAGDAADAQVAAANEASRISREQYGQTREDLAPYRDAGTDALNYYLSFLGAKGPEAAAAARAQFQTSPGYEWEVGEGRKAIEGSAAARGGVLSGGALKAIDEYGRNMANRESGSYLDRFLGLTSLGENAAAQTGNFGAQAAGAQGAYALDAGAARAGGLLGKAGAYAGAIDDTLNLASYGFGKGLFGGTPSGATGGAIRPGSAGGAAARGFYGYI